jgi:hypothetical protein
MVEGTAARMEGHQLKESTKNKYPRVRKSLGRARVRRLEDFPRFGFWRRTWEREYKGLLF